ncbi:hypothetical protein [Algicola sagamiensis]|uniref:hypothetical protein n=1 Tax=Algicola sagamiensis TaxID=163869 RepID=UPI00037DD40A|nr:hypothetical protein [Algicola sagamiensis]
MNSVMMHQADVLRNLMHDKDDTKAHLYLEELMIPVDVQDQILTDISRLDKLTSKSIANILEHRSYSTIPDQMWY